MSKLDGSTRRIREREEETESERVISMKFGQFARSLGGGVAEWGKWLKGYPLAP